MVVEEPKESFVLEAKWVFNTLEQREEFRNHLMSGACFDQNMQPLRMSFSSFFSHCKYCGRPRWMGTIGHNNMPSSGIYKDQCKPAYHRSCENWQKKGGWKSNAELGSRDNV